MYELLSEGERKTLWEEAVKLGPQGAVFRYTLMVEDICFRRMRKMPCDVQDYVSGSPDWSPEDRETVAEPEVVRPTYSPVPGTGGKVVNLFG